MICPRCGVDTLDAASFCKHCGTAVAGSAELREARPPPQAPLPYAPAGATLARPFASGHGRALAATVLLAVCIATDVAGVVSSFLQIQLLSQPHFTEQEADANDIREGCVSMVQSLAFLATAIVYLMWLHRANRNLRALGLSNPQFSPGWAVGYWFIPFLNLVRPYQVVKETWNGSEPSEDAGSWEGPEHRSSAVIGWWWAVWLINGIFGSIAIQVFLQAETPEDWIVVSWASIIGFVLDVLAALLCIRIVRTIDAWQEAKNDHLSARVPTAPPLTAPRT